jgi:hypothetical protein
MERQQPIWKRQKHDKYAKFAQKYHIFMGKAWVKIANRAAATDCRGSMEANLSIREAAVIFKLPDIYKKNLNLQETTVFFGEAMGEN